ncbi:hypothetical protein OIU84_028511 [Salix udensis]|uniref:U-box domain-containing protein n=1 Tax=Salix udensis TaxID=889485 RepID=A0AAD6KD32_9ROSI|nr:hypothetical protein OIU84_028511 [Salix udensis]
MQQNVGSKRSVENWSGRSRTGVKRVSATRSVLWRMGLVVSYRLVSSPLQVFQMMRICWERFYRFWYGCFHSVKKGQSKLGSVQSLNRLVWFLTSGDLSARQNAVLVLKNLLALDQKHVNALVEIEGVFAGLVKLIKEPICPTATKGFIDGNFLHDFTIKLQ